MQKVLLVIADGESELLETVRLCLLQQHLGVVVTENRHGALHHLVDGNLDLVVLDLELPGDESATILRDLKAGNRWKNLPVLGLTENAGAVNGWGITLIRKPAKGNTADLGRAVRNLLGL